MTDTGCPSWMSLAGKVHGCDWAGPHKGHAHYNHAAGATWTGATWHDLAALRAEVVALRDGVDARFEGTGWQRHEYRMATEAYEDVLDLIDKHAREGQ